MKADFNQPQRQSLIGVVVMFTDTMQKALRAFWPLVLVTIFRMKEGSLLKVLLAVAVIVVVVAVIAYLKYRNFTFHIDEDNEEFVVRKGIINKSRLAIPLNKIQQVNINQSLIQRFIGVHALEVDTAGSGKKEISIRAITHDLAIALKSRLLNGVAAATIRETEDGEIAPQELQEEKPFIRISFMTLFKTGMTSNYARSFALLIAFMITMFQYIEDFIQYAEIDDDPLDNYINTEVLLKFMAFIIIAILVITLIINLSRTIIRYFGFKVTKQQNSLLLSYGLLNTKNTIIRPEKVQIVSVGRNFFQKKLEILDVKIRQAAAMEADPEHKQSFIEIPGCNAAERDTLLEFLLNEIPQKGEEIQPNYRKFVFNFFRGVIIPLSIYFTFAYFFKDVLDYIIFLPLYVVFVTLLVYFGYRNSRLYVSNDYIINQHGAWDIDNEYLAPHKIQSISVHQYFWQKPADVGSLTLCTAGGEINFGVADFTKIKQLVNQWLYQVETSKKHWM